MLDLKTPFIFSLVVLSVGAAAQSDESSLQGAHDELEHIEVKRHFQPYRGNVPLIDTPQAIDRITADTLANEGITRFNVRGYSGNRSTVNVQTIEVMKGPGSALYGQGEPGGYH
jgi:iron complex outermembrane receptor protein